MKLYLILVVVYLVIEYLIFPTVQIKEAILNGLWSIFFATVIYAIMQAVFKK